MERDKRRFAKPSEIVRIAHSLRSIRADNREGFEASLSDLRRPRRMLDGSSIAGLILNNKIDRVLEHFDSRDAGNST